MKQTVLITGAHSFIAGYVRKKLEPDYIVKFLTRNPTSENEFAWDLGNRTIEKGALTGVDYIIHLSGSKFNDGTPFTEERKKLVYDSRVGAARFLKEQLLANDQKLKAFISASAIGYYSFNDKDNEIDEDGEKAIGFAADLCEAWESTADSFKVDGIASRVCKIRVPYVLGPEKGVFSSYVNHVMANPEIAEQDNSTVVSWNHIEDMAGIFAFAVQHDLDGVYNAVAPQPASLGDIYKAIANNVHGFDYKLQPFNGKHLVSRKIIDAGYTFKFPEIQQAVNAILVNQPGIDHASIKI